MCRLGLVLALLAGGTSCLLLEAGVDFWMGAHRVSAGAGLLTACVVCVIMVLAVSEQSKAGQSGKGQLGSKSPPGKRGPWACVSGRALD